MKNYKVLIAFLFLLGISVYSTIGFINTTRQKYALLRTNNEIKEQLGALEFEKENLLNEKQALLNEKQSLTQELEKEKQLQQKLSQENSGLKGYLKASIKRLTKVFTGLREAQNTVEQSKSDNSALKAENAALKDEKDESNTQLKQALQENDSLKARLGSIIELKKAIRELKIQVRNVGRKIKQKAGIKDTLYGNRGFLIREGKSTYPAKVKIEVIPAPESK